MMSRYKLHRPTASIQIPKSTMDYTHNQLSYKCACLRVHDLKRETRHRKLNTLTSSLVHFAILCLIRGRALQVVAVFLYSSCSTTTVSRLRAWRLLGHLSRTTSISFAVLRVATASSWRSTTRSSTGTSRSQHGSASPSRRPRRRRLSR